MTTDRREHQLPINAVEVGFYVEIEHPVVAPTAVTSVAHGIAGRFAGHVRRFLRRSRTTRRAGVSHETAARETGHMRQRVELRGTFSAGLGGKRRDARGCLMRQRPVR